MQSTTYQTGMAVVAAARRVKEPTGDPVGVPKGAARGPQSECTKPEFWVCNLEPGAIQVSKYSFRPKTLGKNPFGRSWGDGNSGTRQDVPYRRKKRT